MSARDTLLAVFTAFVWGATFPFTAWALETTPPLFFTALRLAAAAAFVALVPKPAVPWPRLIITGLCLGAGQYGFLFVAMARGLPAGLASLLVHTQAFFTVLIATVVFRERLGLGQLVALGVAAAGLLCIATAQEARDAQAGVLLGLLAAASAAVGNNCLKSMGAVDMLGVAVWMSVAAPVPLLLLAWPLEIRAFATPPELLATITPKTLAALVYSSLLATVFAFAAWGRLFVRYTAATVAPFLLLVPVFGLSLSALLLGERLAPVEWLGALLVFAALVIALAGGGRVARRGGGPDA